LNKSVPGKLLAINTKTIEIKSTHRANLKLITMIYMTIHMINDIRGADLVS